MPRIVVTDATYPQFERERAVAARYGGTLEIANCRSAAEVGRVAQGADVLLVQYAPITSEIIAQLAPNAAIVRYGLGLDNIDLRAAYLRGVRVAYVPDYATGEVADHTVALLLALLRKIPALDRSVRLGQWDPVAGGGQVPRLSELVVGFVGFGRIGREVQVRLRAFGCASLVYDPKADAEALSELDVRAASLDEVFSSADVVTLHAPLTTGTHAVVDARRLALMKPTAVIVNTARGALIDTAALEEALAEKRLGGAALDVFEQEPLPLGSRLRELANIILTPHAAWYSSRSLDRVQALAVDEVDRHLGGRPPRCPAPLE